MKNWLVPDESWIARIAYFPKSFPDYVYPRYPGTKVTTSDNLLERGHSDNRHEGWTSPYLDRNPYPCHSWKRCCSGWRLTSCWITSSMVPWDSIHPSMVLLLPFASAMLYGEGTSADPRSEWLDNPKSNRTQMAQLIFIREKKRFFV